MKKISCLIIAAAAVLLSFSSCKPDNEIYNPVCKISKVWYYSNSDWDHPNMAFKYGEKNMLDSIVVDSVQTFVFAYNKDKTVSQITNVQEDYTEMIDITYEDRLVKKLLYKVNDTVRQEVNFTRDEETKRITHIEEIYDRLFYESFQYAKNLKLYNTLMGDFESVKSRILRSPVKDMEVRCTKEVKYAPGKKEKYEDIESITETYPYLNEVIVRTFAYDEENVTYNPFYGLPYAYTGYSGYHVHNYVTQTVQVLLYGTENKKTVYKYDYQGVDYLNKKKYPRQFTTTSSENNIPRNTYILYVK